MAAAQFAALCAACVGGGVGSADRAALNTRVDELAALDYRSGLFVSHRDARNLITALCTNVEPSDSFLAAKVTHLINNILTKQNLQIELETLHEIISWDLACIDRCSEIVLIDILKNLQTAISHKPQAGRKFIEKLLEKDGILLKFIGDPGKYTKTLNTKVNNLEVISLALKCLLSLTLQIDDAKLSPGTLESVSNVLTKLLFKGYKGGDEYKYCKSVVHTLRILSQIHLDNHEEVTVRLPELVGLCKHYILYGLVSTTTPHKIAPSQQTVAQPPAQNAKGGKKQKVRKQRNSVVESLKKDIPTTERSLIQTSNVFDNKGYKPAGQSLTDGIQVRGKPAWPMTSDSDMSDAESGRDAKLLTLKIRVRQSAVNLFLVLIKVSEKRDMFGYWWALLPDSPTPEYWAKEESTKRTLAYCAVNDPAAVGRAGALSVVLALLSGSRLYLSQAEECKRAVTSFTPFSVTLGHTIACLHKVLCGVLESERDKSVSLVALKCCAALVQATPYHRLQPGLITHLVRVSRSYVMHRDVTVQVAALIVIGCVLSVDPAVDEVLKSVQKDLPSAQPLPVQDKTVTPPDDADCEEFEEGYSDDEDIFVASQPTEQKSEEKIFRSWILDICFRNLGWVQRNDKFVSCNSATMPVLLESLQIISAIAFHHFASLLAPHMKLLGDVFSDLLGSPHVEVSLQTTKSISCVADALLKLESSEHTSVPIKESTYFWEMLLSGPLSTVLQATDNLPAKALACDCVANIGDRVFKELPRHLQMLCCALLNGACGDDDATVRGAAVRALAMCVVYPTLREDLNFVSNCVENILRALREPVLTVRVKASWALGNLTDALLLNMKEGNDMADVEYFVKQLLEASVQCAVENDKIKLNAPRAIGNLLRLVSGPGFPLKKLLDDAVARLLDCTKSSNMKIRWNACYAIGNALKNTFLHDRPELAELWGPVYSTLCTLMLDCKNLKVRINAAVALRSPSRRAHYAEHLPAVWRGVMAAMENAANVDDYTEYRHKDNLVEQLCVTLSHMCCLLTHEDLTEISDPLSFHYECAKNLFTSLSQRLLPETESCIKILEAAKYATVHLTADSESQKQTLGLLQDIFIVVL